MKHNFWTRISKIGHCDLKEWSGLDFVDLIAKNREMTSQMNTKPSSGICFFINLNYLFGTYYYFFKFEHFQCSLQLCIQLSFIRSLMFVILLMFLGTTLVKITAKWWPY